MVDKLVILQARGSWQRMARCWTRATGHTRTASWSSVSWQLRTSHAQSTDGPSRPCLLSTTSSSAAAATTTAVAHTSASAATTSASMWVLFFSPPSHVTMGKSTHCLLCMLVQKYKINFTTWSSLGVEFLSQAHVMKAVCRTPGPTWYTGYTWLADWRYHNKQTSIAWPKACCKLHCQDKISAQRCPWTPVCSSILCALLSCLTLTSKGNSLLKSKIVTITLNWKKIIKHEQITIKSVTTICLKKRMEKKKRFSECKWETWASNWKTKAFWNKDPHTGTTAAQSTGRQRFRKQVICAPGWHLTVTILIVCCAQC